MHTPVASRVASAWPRARSLLSNLALWQRVGPFEAVALGVLLLAALSPYASPTAAALAKPEAYQSVWSVRLLGGPNLVELALLAAGLVWLVVVRRQGWALAALDRWMAGLVTIFALAHLLALARGGRDLLYQPLDVERVALLVTGYLLASRVRLRAEDLSKAVYGLGLVLVAVAAVLTVRYGLVGSTQFGTGTGRDALLITEDSLLVGLGLVLLWGLHADGLLSRRATLGVFVLVLAVLTVDVLSLRRGALIFIVAMIAARGFRHPFRALAPAAILVALSLAIPSLISVEREGQSKGSDAGYVVRSTALKTEDASTGQRTAELRNYRRNLAGPGDLLLGRGLGAAWTAYVRSPVDRASFGSGETPARRVGWHVYGLDWLYKIGIIGVVAVLALLAHAAVTSRKSLRQVTDRRLRAAVWSLAAAAPVLALMMFTNARLAFFAGVSLGLLSLIVTPGFRRDAIALPPTRPDSTRAPNPIA